MKKPKILFKQGGLTAIIVVILTFVVYSVLPFGKQDIETFTKTPIGFITTPKGYASLMIVLSWLFVILAFFLPFLQEAVMVHNNVDWDDEYPLYKPEFENLRDKQGENHPALVAGLLEASVKEAASMSSSEIILEKKSEAEAKADELVASLSFDISPNEEIKEEKGNIELLAEKRDEVIEKEKQDFLKNSSSEKNIDDMFSGMF